MTKLRTKILGKEQVLEQQAAHFLSEALDEFLVAEYPDTVLSSLIKLSIGLEIFVKKSLEEIDSSLIHAKINFRQWEQLDTIIEEIPTRKAQREHILTHFTTTCSQDPDRTINFSVAIGLFPYFYRIPKRIVQDLNDLRNYRNGLFHWEAPEQETFRLSKQALRLFEWILEFIQKKIGWWLGGELNTIDPMGVKRRRLKKLKECNRSENAFNMQRRIFKHSNDFALYSQIRARLEGFVINPRAKNWPQACPACNYETMQVFEGGKKRDGKWEERIVFAQCIRCDFACSDKEYESIRPNGHPTLKQVFASLS